VTIAHGNKTTDGIQLIDTVNLSKLVRGSDPVGNIQVHSGDIVNVSTAPVIYVVGAVTKPGGFVMEDPGSGVTVIQAIALAEGLQPIAAPKQGPILPRTNTARFRLSWGGIDAPRLIHKLVKPGKVTRSCRTDEIGIDQLLVIETKPEMRTAHAAVLGEADSAVGRELGSLNLIDRCSHKAAKLHTLLFRDGGLEVLDFRVMFPHKDDERHVRNASDPGIADQLGVKRQQPRWFFGIATGSRLPVHKTSLPIEFADGVNIGHKLIGVGEFPNYLDLEILLWLRNLNSIVLGKALEQMHPLVD